MICNHNLIKILSILGFYLPNRNRVYVEVCPLSGIHSILRFLNSDALLIVKVEVIFALVLVRFTITPPWALKLCTVPTRSLEVNKTSSISVLFLIRHFRLVSLLLSASQRNTTVSEGHGFLLTPLTYLSSVTAIKINIVIRINS